MRQRRLCIAALASAASWAAAYVDGDSAASQPASGPRTRLAWSDFEYVGAFRAPRVTEQQAGSRYGYSRAAMCWNPFGDPDGPKDGFPGSIMIPGHPSKGLVGEMSIPAPKKLTDADKQPDGTYDTRRLPMAGQLGKFFDPTSGKKNVFPKRAENWRGLCWVGDQLHISWSLWYHVDSEVQNYPHHMAASRLKDGTWKTVVEPFSFPHINPHRSAGYIAPAPKWWADKHLGGRRMLTGFNVNQGVGASNCGPGLYAYDPAKPAEAIVLMQFPHGRDVTQRDTNWKPSDQWRGLKFIDTGAKVAVMYCGRKSLGPVRYGVGRPTDASRSKGYHCDPYRPEIRLYDPATFVDVLAGRKKPHQPRPYETTDLTKTFFQPDRGFVTAGIGYDPANRLLYVAQVAGDRDSGRYEAHPVFHVWRIKPNAHGDDR